MAQKANPIAEGSALDAFDNPPDGEDAAISTTEEAAGATAEKARRPSR